MTPTNLRRAALAASFAGLTVAGLVFAFLLPQTPGRMSLPTSRLIVAHPLWSFLGGLPVPVPGRPVTVAATAIATVALAFGSYGVAVWAAWRWPGRASRAVRLAVLGGVALLAVSAASMPNTTTDVYNYIMRGRVAAAHGENPYYTAADRFPDDPVHPYAGHRYTSEPGGKGPAWMAVNVTLARVAGDDVVSSLLVYRLALFLFAAGSIGLVAWILRRIEPRHALAGVVIFGWSPVVTVYGPAKTDTLMVFLLLLGTAALVPRRTRRAAVALVLSGLVKLITLPLLGAYWLRELRHRRWREAGWIGGLALATAAAVLLPFSRDPGVVLGLLDAADSAGSDVLALRPLWLVGFGGLVAWVGLTRNRGLPHLLRGWAFITLYFSALLMPIALAWYQMTMIAVVALVRDVRIALSMGALSFASLGLATWRSVERQATFELPMHLPLPGHAAYLAPLLLLGGLAAFLLFRRRRRSAAEVRGTGDPV